MTVSRLTAELSSGELTHWMAFSQLEPFGAWVDDIRAGTAAAVSANLNRQEGKEVILPQDFFPWTEKPVVEPAPATPEEVAANVIALFDRATHRHGDKRNG